MTVAATERIEFKAEIKQVLDILIHSLYSEQEIFLRELISNASDALNRFKIESLKSNNQVLDPSAPLGIWISADKDSRSLTIKDTGIGMTQEEMVKYLGTIAHSGAKHFIEAMKELNKGDSQTTTDVIGQFGVGFYSVFMVAEEVTVHSRSFMPDSQAAFWKSSGEASYEIGLSDKAERGTTIEIKLKEDAKDYAESYRLRQIIKEHSDFVAFPIYLEEASPEEANKGQKVFNQVNAQTALWRERPSEVAAEKYKSFYQQLTFDFQEPLKTLHFQAEMPIQFYALLFIPSRRDYKMFQRQDDYGLKLYARKVLIKEDFKELLPPYLRFIEGVVDSEDLPLNVSREMVQNTPMIARMKKAILGRVSTELERFAKEDETGFNTFYKEFGQFLKEGIASDASNTEKFLDLLRFASTATEGDTPTSLHDYSSRMKPEQKDIYYVLGDDAKIVARSSHLDYFRKNDLEVLFLTDPMDNFMLMGLTEYQGKKLKNIDDADLELPEAEKKIETPKDESFISLVAFIKQLLGAKLEDVRESKVLTDSAVRLVNPSGGASSFYRAQRLMGQSSELPKKILELNPKHEIIKDLGERLKVNSNDALLPILIEQLYENELLAEGIHPNPAEMIPRLQKLIAEALKKA